MAKRPKMLRLFLPLTLMLGTVPACAESPQLAPRLTELSTAGSGEAAYHLGMIHHLGLSGVAKDGRKAFEYFKLSAERGDPLGAYKYGCYFDGQGEGIVESDSKLALRFKLIAAQAGYALAQQDVAAHLFASGDTSEGLRWLEAAAAQGDMMSLIMLGGLYSGDAPEGLPKLAEDRAKSHAYLELAFREVPDMRQMLDTQAKELTESERARAKAIVSAWREKRSALTLKADVGLGAAYAYAGLPVPTK